jgi:predicted anti-sigma-YlaC factor YlaD
VPTRLFSLAAASALLVSTGCTGFVTNLIADKLGGEGSAFASDDDPELVAAATPFGLKTVESLLQGSPDNRKLLLAAASGFTQYAFAFVQEQGQRLEDTNPDEARHQLDRARRLYARAVAYGLRGLQVEHDDFIAEFEADPARAAGRVTDEEDVPFLYWTGAALGAQIALSKDDMKMIGRLPEVEALMGRALALAPDWNDGAIREFYITFDGGLSEAMGGSVERARQHYERVLELTQGKKMGPHVTWAEVVAVQAQDRTTFDTLLDQVLAFDVDEAPQFRLVNVIAQNRARWLKSRAEDLFLEE